MARPGWGGKSPSDLRDHGSQVTGHEPHPLPSRRNLARSSGRSTSKSHHFSSLPALIFSCRSFSDLDPLFSITSGLFDKDTRGGIPLPAPSRVSQAQNRHFLSPLLATLTDSLSRNSFPCRSYANTRGVGITPRKFLASGLQLSTVDCKLPSALTTFRINTCVSVASKGLYLPLESTLMKKPGEGGGVHQPLLPDWWLPTTDQRAPAFRYFAASFPRYLFLAPTTHPNTPHPTWVLRSSRICRCVDPF